MTLKQVKGPASALYPSFHVAFSAAFHTAPLQVDGPGLLEHYGPNYYAAFVVDLRAST